VPIIRIAMRLCALLLIGGTLAPAPAGAQSLAEVARKEAERRQRVKEPAKIYTNQELRPAPAPPGDSAATPADRTDVNAAAPDKSSADAGSNPAGTRAGDAKSATPSDGGKEAVHDQAYWSKRIASLRDQLNRDVVYSEALQSRINGLTTDFVNRDDPVQRAQIASDRQRAIDELARLKKGTEEDRKAIADLEEEARRAGVPAGWLR
jgi:hypothetical protein